MLVETTLFQKIDKVQEAVGRLKHFEPPEGYYLAFSGGKDSVVIKELADMAGVKYDAHYNVTTIDPPELVYFIRDYHKDVIWDRPEIPFLKNLATTKGFPQRHRRWCCVEYKERYGADRRVVTGVRREESQMRASRKVFHHCYKGGLGQNKTYLNPIVDWTESDVWDFIHEHDLPYCSLYDEGFKRIGCMFCPMARKQRQVEAKRYPQYVKAFIRAFERLYATGRQSMARWRNGEDMFWWWMDSDRVAPDPDQLFLFD